MNRAPPRSDRQVSSEPSADVPVDERDECPSAKCFYSRCTVDYCHAAHRAMCAFAPTRWEGGGGSTDRAMGAPPADLPRQRAPGHDA